MPPFDQLVVIQARMGSSRLPGKVLQDLGGMPMLAFQLRRLAQLSADPATQVVVATSDLPGDDPVAELVGGEGVSVVRGSEADVLGRFVLVLDHYPADTVVRLTGDCPLSDPGVVRSVLAEHARSGAAYTSNVLPRSFPKGLDVEVIAASALRAAEERATEPADREHVTPYIYRRPGEFGLANVMSGFDLGDEGWTVDTASDLERIRSIVDRLDNPVAATWDEIRRCTPSTNAVVAGEPKFVPARNPEPGSSPWVRAWTVSVDERPVGLASVIRHDDRCERVVDVSSEWRDATIAALESMLCGDQQCRP